MASARIDKWLWAVRLFKTRSAAAEACKKGHISLNEKQAKPAHTVKEGDVVGVRRPPVTWSFRVMQAIEKRVGAKLLGGIMKNVTAASQLAILERSKLNGFIDRAKGTGRPTKKDRREMDEFTGLPLAELFDFDPEDMEGEDDFDPDGYYGEEEEEDYFEPDAYYEEEEYAEEEEMHMMNDYYDYYQDEEEEEYDY